VTPERWQVVKTVLDDVLERAAAERTAYLALRCQGDDELRGEVESLLAAEVQAADFIETPVFRIRMDDAPPLATGQRIGSYRIVREISRGGMGTVYLAERADEEFERRVALKVIRRGMDSDEIVERFRAERQILAHLDHENIAKLLDGGTTEDGRPYFVMEYVEGQPLDEYCDVHGLSRRERLALFRRVCAAVHFAHQNLIVHRDLKPGNVLVTADGVPKLLDFGIAKLLHPGQEPFALTRADLRPMTPEFASPEQVRGAAISTASDVYSLGVLLYRLLTGRSPYSPTSSDPQGLARAICDQDPPRPSSTVGRGSDQRGLARQLRGDLDNIVLKAMSKEPGRRYASVDQLANDLDRYLKGLPVIARKDTLGYRTGKFVGRHKLGVSVVALLLLLIVGFSITVTLLLQQQTRERRRAERETKRAASVLDFLEKVFHNPDPERARGQPITALEVLDSGMRDIRGGLQDQPEVRADLMETMGRVYRRLGVPNKARELLEGSLQLRRGLKQDELAIARNLHNLAGALHDLHDDKAAEPLIREALQIQRARGDTHNLDYAKGLGNLGQLLADKGQLANGEALLKESLALKRRLPGTEAGDIATSLNNLGILNCQRADYASCERYHREALTIRRRLAAGQPDPYVARSLNNLASALEDLGKLAEAESLYRDSIAMRKKLYGNRNPSVTPALSNLGHVLQQEGKAAEAEPYYREAAAIAEETVGKDNLNRAIYVRNLASALLTMGKAVEAEASAREALGIFRVKKPDSWRVPETESLLGSCLAAQGRYQEAEPLLTGSYPRLVKDQGEGAKHAGEARNRIVTLYTAWGKPEKAAAYRTGG
jgi:eukaryotic-like serine/threonine-protein kinase